MALDLLMRRYARLQRALASAYGTLPWQTEKIDKLADRLAATERLIATTASARDRPGPGLRGTGAQPSAQSVGD